MKRIAWSVMLLVMSAGLIACAAQRAVPAEELLRLGEQYLLELDYEQALAQFLKVVELEPMNPRGYTGAAEAYVGLGDVDSAIDILVQGFSQIGDDELQRLAERLLMGADSLDLHWSAEELLQEMYGVFESDVETGLEAFSALYDVINNFSKDVPTLYCSPEGNGIGVYYSKGDGSRGAFYFLYYGQFDGRQRNGTGLWYCAIPTGTEDGGAVLHYTHRFEGQWANDLPNGYGEYRVVPTIWEQGRVEEYGYRGKLNDGYWDGEVWSFSGDREWPHMFANGYEVFGDGQVEMSENREGIPGVIAEW